MNRPLLASLAWMVALLVSGLTAGMFLMDLAGYYSVLPRLPDRTAIELHQASVPLRRLILRLAIGGSGLTTLVLLLLAGEGLPRRLLVANLLCLVTLVIYTNGAVVPLNREIAAWKPDSPPPGWQIVFARMVVLERLRSVLPLVAFVLELVGGFLRMKP